MSTILKGITWGHSRGYTPLVAASQRFTELNPNVEIVWKKRTLQEFADLPIEALTKEYDLLIIDHPWVGCAAATQCVLALDQYLPKEFLADQKTNSVGRSHESYNYNNHQWALAIDAATPVASYRKDLFEKNNSKVPTSWNDLLALAEAGKVAVPAIPIDLLMNFYMFCIAHGNEPFQQQDKVVDDEIGVLALNTMRDLWKLVDRKMFTFNPIAVAEVMTITDQYWYCPFAYGYSNYSRQGYAQNLLHYTGLVLFNQQPLRSTIGGTGIAVSAFSSHQNIAIDFAQWVVSPQIQSTFYVEHGGQPGHKQAWISKHANALTNNYFTNVFPTMEHGFIRPRYDGYLHFQDHAGVPIQQFLLNGGSPEKVLEEVNVLYNQSITSIKTHQLS